MDSLPKLALGLLALLWVLAFLVYVAPRRHPWVTFAAMARLRGFLALTYALAGVKLCATFAGRQARRIGPRAVP